MFEELFIQRNHNEIYGYVMSWRLDPALPDSAELKAYVLSG